MHVKEKKHGNTSRATWNLDTTWWGLGPIFREVRVRSIGGDLDVDDPASNQQDSNLATITPLLRWLSTKHNLIDLAKKTFPASEIEEHKQERVNTQSDNCKYE